MTRILLVDASRLSRRLGSMLLDWMGVELMEASTGEAALPLIRAEKPELVIMDPALPDMDGLEICRQIKKDPATQQVKIILLSACRDEQKIREAIAAGCDEYLTKPLHDETLVLRAKSWLHNEEIRQFPRIKLSLQISFEDFKGIFFEYARNISQVGVFIEMRQPVAEGTRLRLLFSLPPPYDHPVQAFAQVIHSIPEGLGRAGGVGARFLYLDDESKQILESMTQDHDSAQEAASVFSQVSYQQDEPLFSENSAELAQQAILHDELSNLQTSFDHLLSSHVHRCLREVIWENICQANSREAVIHLAMDAMEQLWGALSCHVWRKDETSQDLVSIGSRNNIRPDQELRVPLTGPLAQSLDENMVLIPAQIWQPAPSSPVFFAIIPYREETNELGLLSIQESCRHQDAFRAQDLALMTFLGHHLGPALSRFK